MLNQYFVKFVKLKWFLHNVDLLINHQIYKSTHLSQLSCPHSIYHICIFFRSPKSKTAPGIIFLLFSSSFFQDYCQRQMFYFENHTADSTAATGQILSSSIIPDNLSLSTVLSFFYVTSEVKQLQGFSLGKAFAGVSVDTAMRLFWRYVEMASARGYSWNIWTRGCPRTKPGQVRTIKMSSAATLRTKSLTSRHKSGFQTNQIFKMSNFHDIQIVVEIIIFFDYFSFFASIRAKAADWQAAAMTKRFPLPEAESNIFPGYFWQWSLRSDIKIGWCWRSTTR